MANPSDLKLLADAMFWVLHYDTVTPHMYMLKTGCTEQFAAATFIALSKIGIIVKSNQSSNDFNWIVTITRMDQIPNDMLNVLCANGHDIKSISNALQGLPKGKKKVESNILKDSAHKWNEIGDDVPTDTPIIIRLTNPNITFMESRNTIIYAEDLKIASYDGVKWTIRGPYPMYDYSPCSNKDQISSDAEVTHWSTVNDKDIENWDHRFDQFHEYNEFKLKVDDDKSEAVYHALLLAASALSNAAVNYNPEDETRQAFEDAYQYICDLQVVFDRGGDINAVDKK